MLDGIRVVDFSRLLPGPYATRVLAELGAEVIKIEAKDGGDYARWWPPLTGEPPMSGMFRELNAGKKSVALDLRQPAATAALRRLCLTADVIIDSYRPGTLAKMGLDPAGLRAEQPRLVYCAITGFGLTGPDAQRAGHDLGFVARSGLLGLTGPRERPVALGIQVSDVGASWVAVSAILAALFRRERTGQGGVVDTALVEAAIPFGVLEYGVAHAGQPIVRGEMLLDGSRPCYGVYATRGGGFLAVGALEPKFWRAFVEAIGLPHLADAGLDEGEAGARVRAEVEARLLERTRDEWAALFRTVDACVEPVLALDEAERDPQLVARDMIDGAHGFVRSPIHVSGAAARALAAPPALGEHTREVLAGLGLADHEIDLLVG